jgi:hypothetical protein
MCAVAKAQLAGVPRLAFCCDFLVTSDYDEHEDISKYDFLCEELAAVYSGPTTTAQEIFRLYKRRLKDAVVSDDTIYALLRDTMDEFRQRVHARAHMTYKSPPVELLIFGFIESNPRIYYVSQKTGRVREQEYKYAIGSGSYAAQALLDWRGLSDTWTLDKTLYSLYEAKKISEAGPPVGKKATMLGFLEPLGDLSFMMTPISRTDLTLLDAALAQFGPRPITPDWHLPGRITGAIARDHEDSTPDLQSPPASQG